MISASGQGQDGTEVSLLLGGLAAGGCHKGAGEKAGEKLDKAAEKTKDAVNRSFVTRPKFSSARADLLDFSRDRSQRSSLQFWCAGQFDSLRSALRRGGGCSGSFIFSCPSKRSTAWSGWV